MSGYNRRSTLFLERLKETILVGDGAMGTLLYSRGIPLEANFEYLSLIRPELVEEVHRDYVRAGSQVIETNSFGANASKLAAIGLEKKVRAINEAAARLARKAAGEECFVAGSVGPLVRPREEGGEVLPTERREVFREQMEALAEGGADIFLLETFSDLEELAAALEVARRIGLPAVAQMAFLEEGRTREGVSAEEAARRLSLAGASVLGANCGSGPRELLRVVGRMAAVSDLPLSAFPNSGFPQYVEGRYIYLATPEYFAATGREMARAGASLIGGCCGTTPEHIAALTAALAEIRPAARPRPEPAGEVAARPVPPPPPRATFLDDWDRRPVVTVELDPPRGSTAPRCWPGPRLSPRPGSTPSVWRKILWPVSAWETSPWGREFRSGPEPRLSSTSPAATAT